MIDNSQIFNWIFLILGTSYLSLFLKKNFNWNLGKYFKKHMYKKTYFIESLHAYYN